VQTTERIKTRGIRLELTGKAETSWTEGSGDDATSYRGREEYMNLEIYLIGSRSHDSEIYLEPSVYKYPFSFILAPELPQSFHDRIGHIRYIAKAVVDRPLKIDDTAEVLFTVIHLLDLNREPPHLREPLVMQCEQPPSGCCCVDGFVEINATINKGCFVLGETIRVDGEIANRTNTNIKYSTVTLFQNIEYRATYQNTVHRTKQALTTLAKFERPFLRRGHTDSLSNISFVVPQVYASRLDGCGIIDIKYYIEVSAVFHQCCSKSTASREIVIGNVPLRDTSQPPPVVTSQPLGFSVPYDMSGGYNMPPPYMPTSEFDTAGVKAWNHNGKDLPEVHAS
jgi:hypothetical protein